MSAEAGGEIDIAAQLDRIRRALAAIDEKGADGGDDLLKAVGDGPVQDLLGAVVRLFAACREHDAGVEAVDRSAPPTATEALITVSALLEAVEVEPFELGLWANWGIRGGSGGAGAER
jgi:hypothetical protein